MRSYGSRDIPYLDACETEAERKAKLQRLIEYRNKNRQAELDKSRPQRHLDALVNIAHDCGTLEAAQREAKKALDERLWPQ